jgi:hypothetical protein
MKCKDCKADCNEMVAKTEKNFGKQFWSCPNRCKCWNGWIDCPPVSQQDLKKSIKQADSYEDEVKPVKKTQTTSFAAQQKSKPALKNNPFAEYAFDNSSDEKPKKTVSVQATKSIPKKMGLKKESSDSSLTDDEDNEEDEKPKKTVVKKSNKPVVKSPVKHVVKSKKVYSSDSDKIYSSDSDEGDEDY